MSLTKEKYSEKSFVVRGNTDVYQETLSRLNGTPNQRLRGGPGWIFSNKQEKTVDEFLESLKTFSPIKVRERKNQNVPKETLTKNELLSVVETLQKEITRLQHCVHSLTNHVQFLPQQEVKIDYEEQSLKNKPKKMLKSLPDKEVEYEDDDVEEEVKPKRMLK